MRISSINPALAHRGVDLKVNMFLREYRPYWPNMVKKIVNRELFLRTLSIGALPPAQAINEGTSVFFADISTPFGLDFYKAKRGIGFALSIETIERDELSVFKDRASMIANSIEQAREISLASFMNLATQGGPNFVCPDGVAWASASHPYANGVFTNILSTSGALGPAALAQALAELATQPDHNGIPLGYNGPVVLWVHPNNADESMRICHSAGYPNTSNNEGNFAGRRVVRILENPFFTNPASWAVVADGEKNPFTYIDERQTRFQTWYEGTRDIQLNANYSTWGQGMFDARGWVWSPGL